MIERRVRSDGRPVYGRAQALGSRPSRRGQTHPRLSPLQGRLLLALGVLAVAGWGVGQLFALRTIRVEAPARQAAITTEVRTLTSASVWQGNLLTLNAQALGSKLQQADPSLRSVSIQRHWLHAITVTVTLKQPSLQWSTGNQIYVLDRDGTVIGQPAGTAAGLPLVYDGSNLPVQIGQQAVSSHFIEFVEQLVPGLAADGVTVTRLDIKDTTLDLSAQTNKGYRLLFDTSRGADDEIADLKAVQRLLAAQKKTPADYIDLRVAGKAYYK